MKQLWIAVLLISGLLMTACGTSDSRSQKLPFGVMDAPRTGETLKSNAALGGWALSEVGIKEIAVYVDRSYVTSGEINSQRPDVAKAYPDIPNGNNSGWNIQLDTSPIPPGPHELVVRAIDNNGAVRDIGSVLVTIAR